MNAEYEASLKRCDQQQLEAMLKEVEARLGTCAERDDDFERARTIAHQLDNLVLSLRLREEVGNTVSGDGHLPIAYRPGSLLEFNRDGQEC